VFSLRLNLLQICRPFDDSTANRLASKLIRTLGRFSPGLITAVLFFIPVGIATFWTAWTTGIACAGEIGLSLLIVRQLMNKITLGYVPTKIELPDARNAYRAVEDAVYCRDSNLKLL